MLWRDNLYLSALLAVDGHRSVLSTSVLSTLCVSSGSESSTSGSSLLVIKWSYVYNTKCHNTKSLRYKVPSQNHYNAKFFAIQSPYSIVFLQNVWACIGWGWAYPACLGKQGIITSYFPGADCFNTQKWKNYSSFWQMKSKMFDIKNKLLTMHNIKVQVEIYAELSAHHSGCL